MYAIFEAKGKQFRATPDQKIRMPSIGAEPGDRVTFDTVLLAQKGAGEDVLIGRPSIEGASVAVEVLRHGRDDKIIVYKMKRRKGYRRKQGHRQKFTEVKVVEIDLGTGKSVKPAAEAKKAEAKKAETKKAAPKAEAKKEEKAARAETPKKAEAKAAEPEAAKAAAPDATPAAADLAAEEGIDLTAIEGTGKDGRILKSDVEAAIKAREGD
ncbi:MAG: 50S ribosomal protein L21 [Gemmatimonadales bacterium]|jgi:large subunit ribosomal protein L21